MPLKPTIGLNKGVISSVVNRLLRIMNTGGNGGERTEGLAGFINFALERINRLPWGLL